MNQKTKILIIVLAVFAGILFGLRLLVKIPSQKVVYFLPENLATNISTTSLNIQIDFSYSLTNENQYNINIVPEIKTLLKKLDNNGKTLRLTSEEPLHPNTNYQITIKDKNKTLWQSSFTTEKLQGDPVIPFEGQKYTQDNYPLLEYIPYETENFSVRYSAPLTLTVTIKKGEQKTIEPSIKEWIKSHSVDPSTHQFKWVTPAPSPAL